MYQRQEESPSRRLVRELSAVGRSPRQIADQLGISTQAVYQHLKKIEAAEEDEQATA